MLSFCSPCQAASRIRRVGHKKFALQSGHGDCVLPTLRETAGRSAPTNPPPSPFPLSPVAHSLALHFLQIYLTASSCRRCCGCKSALAAACHSARTATATTIAGRGGQGQTQLGQRLRSFDQANKRISQTARAFSEGLNCGRTFESSWRGGEWQGAGALKLWQRKLVALKSHVSTCSRN